ncbi:OstA-like protein [Algoriphagus marinus]|uniref:OstA-like protein n=1 Tax=Algoriphagus marinus TaxID=1925762 RepID=UPI00094B97A0|nr:OstA-like protein [Algoriphagus marinus]
MTQKLLSLFLFTLFFSGITGKVIGQASSTLEIRQADVLEGAEGFERLIGSVRMKNQNTLIYCDSAHFFRMENKARLFGNVIIEDEVDSVKTRSAYAEYDGNTKLAKLRNKVVFTNEATTLYTEYLDYDRLANIAYYYNDGKVVDSVNVLTSERGKYEVNLERITFQNEVVLVNPDYTMKTDYLVYLTVPKTAETKGLTNLVSKDGNKLDAQEGSFYNTQSKQFRFFDGIVETETSRIKGKELFYDELAAYYKGEKDVSVLNKERQVEIFGDVGEYWEERKYSLVHGNALVRRYFEKDTLYMTSDSLISQDNEADSAKFLLAFRAIKILNKDISGVADSLVYNYSDSSIRLFQDPVMWNNKSQISADSMVFYIVNEQLDRVYLKDNGFVITQDTLFNSNQMKGRTLNGYFEDGQISRLDIDGNGESLYFALEGDTLTQGVNKTLSATIKLRFADGVITRVTYGVKPDGRFTPFQMLDEETSKLSGYNWRIEEKPSMEDIIDWRKVEEVDPKAKNLFNLPDAQLRMPTEDEIRKSIEKRTQTTGKRSLNPKLILKENE